MISLRHDNNMLSCSVQNSINPIVLTSLSFGHDGAEAEEPGSDSRHVSRYQTIYQRAAAILKAEARESTTRESERRHGTDTGIPDTESGVARYVAPAPVLKSDATI